MTTDNDTTPREGGADWEIGEAARKLSEALGANEAPLLVAMSDYAAALGSKSTQMIAAMLVPLMQALQDTRHDVAALAQAHEASYHRQEARYDSMLAYADRLITKEDASREVYARELKEAAGLFRSALPMLQELRADTEQLKAGQAAYNGRLDEMDVRHGAQLEEIAATVEHIRERLAMDEARLDKKRLELDQMHQEIARINEYIASSRRRELDDVKARLSVIEQRLEGRGDGT